MILRTAIVLTALASLAAGASPAGEPHPDQAAYLWPLAAPPQLSSHFAEYRTAHFHGGIDLSTYGREGVPVFAVADGEVARVRASGLGFGRTLYLRLTDGRLAVYAHLAGIFDPLARYVEAVQDSLGLYRVDLYPEPGRFPVRRGQVVGRSGSSGAGGPHLHFELRDGDVALDPLTHGLAAADLLPPTLTALVFTPLEPAARVNGEPRKLRVKLAPAVGGGRAPAREIQVWGRVGVGIAGFDGSGAGDRMGIKRLELQVDGTRTFAADFERFDYNRAREVEAEFDYEETRAGRRGVLNLFVPEALSGDFHRGLAPGAGVLDLAPGLHRLRIAASDAAGNTSVATATVRAAGPPILRALELLPGEDGPRLVAEAAGCGARLARVEVERGARQGMAFSPWRQARVTGDRLEVALGQVAFDNPHDALAVRVVDEAGRRSNRLVALARAGRAASKPAESAGPAVRLDPGPRVARIEIAFPRPLAAPPVLELPGTPEIVLDALDTRRFVARIDARGQGPLAVRARLADGSPVECRVELPWRAVPRTGSGSVEALGGRVRIDFSSGAFFQDAYVWVGEGSLPVGRASPLPAGLLPVSGLYRVEPADLPLDAGLWVGVRHDSAASGHVALYGLDTTGVHFEGAEPARAGESGEDDGEGGGSEGEGGSARGDGGESGGGRGHWIGAPVLKLGGFLLARDTVPPHLRLEAPRSGVVAGRRPLLAARVRDAESGLREDDVTFLIDGHRVPTEYDPESGSMRHRPRTPLAPGRHTITAQATDRAGMRAEVDAVITLR